MAELLRRHSLFLTSVFLLVMSFQLMSASIKNRALPELGGRVVTAAMAPVQELHHEITESIGYFWNHYLWLVNVEGERNELIQRVNALEAQNSKYIEIESENQRLRSLLNFQEQSGLAGVTATVIGRDPSNFRHTLTLDRGASNGITTGLPVVDGNAVVGQTIVVSDNSTRVLLLTDVSSAIDVFVQSSRAPAIAEGLLSGKLRLRYVLKDYEIKLGDRVIASGLDGVYPKGTLIGIVTSIDKATTGIFQYVEVTPSADMDRLENVLVVTSREAAKIDQLSEELIPVNPGNTLFSND